MHNWTTRTWTHTHTRTCKHGHSLMFQHARLDQQDTHMLPCFSVNIWITRTHAHFLPPPHVSACTSGSPGHKPTHTCIYTHTETAPRLMFQYACLDHLDKHPHIPSCFTMYVSITRTYTHVHTHVRTHSLMFQCAHLDHQGTCTHTHTFLCVSAHTSESPGHMHTHVPLCLSLHTCTIRTHTCHYV